MIRKPLRGKLRWQASGRAAGPRDLQYPCRSEGADRAMAQALQHRPTAQCPRLSPVLVTPQMIPHYIGVNTLSECHDAWLCGFKRSTVVPVRRPFEPTLPSYFPATPSFQSIISERLLPLTAPPLRISPLLPGLTADPE